MTEDLSRRKMLSLLGFGAALGFTLSAAVEPLEAEAQTVAQAAPAAAPAATAPAQATGTHGMQRRAGRRTTRHQRRAARHGKPAARLLHPLHRNSDLRREL